MYSKKFFIELPYETDEFDVYHALRNAGLTYARVKPLHDYCEDKLCPINPQPRMPGEGIG